MHPRVDEHGAFIFRHDAADHDANMTEAGGAQRVGQLRYDEMIGRQRADADHVNVLLHRQLDHGGNGLPRRRVDHLHAGIAQERGDDAAAAIVPVEPDLGDEHTRGWRQGGYTHLRLRIGLTPASARSGASNSRAMACTDLLPSRYQTGIQFMAPSKASRAIVASRSRGNAIAEKQRLSRAS